jgi:hypothetical protein
MSSSGDTVSVSDFNIDLIKFGDMKPLENNGKYVPLTYNNKPFKLQTPECITPFGANSFKDKKTGVESHSIELAFKDMKQRPILEAYMKVIKAIDELAIDKATENSRKWLKKDPERAGIASVFHRAIRYPTDEDGTIIEKYPPTHRLKLIKDTLGAFRCITYDKATGRERPADEMLLKTKGAKVTAIGACSGIWLAGAKFGVSWKAEQLQIQASVISRANAFKSYPEDLIDGSDKLMTAEDAVLAEEQEDICEYGVENADDKEKIEDEAEGQEEEEEEVVAKIVKSNKVQVPDSDDDSDNNSDNNSEVPPAPVEPIKKVIKKKVAK